MSRSVQIDSLTFEQPGEVEIASPLEHPGELCRGDDTEDLEVDILEVDSELLA
jgi:hypothetical protein